MQILDTLLGKEIVDALIGTLYAQDDDFPEIHQSYLAAIDTLNRVLGQDAKHSVQKYTAAIEQQCASNLFFAGVLGIQMNLEHFRNPMAPNCTWEQVDYDDYIHNAIECHWKGVLSHDFTPGAVYQEAKTIGADFVRIGSHLVNLKRSSNVLYSMR